MIMAASQLMQNSKYDRTASIHGLCGDVVVVVCVVASRLPSSPPARDGRAGRPVSQTPSPSPRRTSRTINARTGERKEERAASYW